MVKVIILFLIIGMVFYLLYINGFLTIQSKRAVLYIGSIRGNSARFSSCTGHTKRIIKFKDSKTYRVVFEPVVADGSISIEILDSAKQQIICLDTINRSGNIYAEKGKRYYLLVRFKSATGRYTLNWK